MQEYKGSVDIKINLPNGVYDFRAKSATGKTRLAKLLKDYAADGEPVMSYSYNDKVNGVPFDSVVHPGKQKLLVLDRYDLYNGEFKEQIEEFAKTGVVLIDIKGPTSIDSELCYIEMTEDCIEVTE